MRWFGLGVLIVVLWAGVFLAASLAVERRQEPTDTGLLEAAVEDLQGEVSELRTAVERISQGGNAPVPSAAATATPAPGVVEASLEAGEEVPLRGLKLFVRSVEVGPAGSGKVVLGVENVDSTPEESRIALARVVDVDGFLCALFQETPPPIEPGEKANVPINFECEKTPATLTVESVRFAFPGS